MNTKKLKSFHVFIYMGHFLRFSLNNGIRITLKNSFNLKLNRRKRKKMYFKRSTSSIMLLLFSTMRSCPCGI